MKKTILLSAMAFCGMAVMAHAGVEVNPLANSKGQDYKVNASVSRQLVDTHDANATVLSERVLAPGVSEQECVLKNGVKYKRIVKADAQPVKVLKAPSSKADAEGALLNEGFEGWDGTTKNWIPATWSEINSEGEAGSYDGGAFTWFVSGQAGTLPTPVEGKYYCVIPYARVTRADNKKEDLPQDEWLVTPKMKLRTNEQLSFNISYSPLYLYDMSNENINFGTMEFIHQIISATLKVYIRENGGEWKEIYDIEPAWRNYSLNDLFNNYYSQRSEDVVISLKNYEGKEVEIAFRYVGIRGNTMELDKVVVDKAKLTALYQRPAGTMYWGLSKNIEYPLTVTDGGSARTFLHVPAYTDLTWTNRSSANVESVSWKYLADDGTAQTSTDKDLVSGFIPSRSIEGLHPTPELTVKAQDFADESYKLPVLDVYAGGAPEMDGKTYPLTLANVQKDDVSFLFNSQSIPLSGFHKFTKNIWTQMLLGKNPTDSAYYAPFGFMTKYEKPAKPYIVKRVWVLAYGMISETSKFGFAFYRCSPNDMPYAGFAGAECAYADIVKVPMGNFNYYAIPFDVAPIEGSNPVVIDRDVFGLVYGLDCDQNNTIYLLQTISYDKNDTNSQYFYLSGMNNGKPTSAVLPAASLTDNNGNELKTHLFMELETEFPWLKAIKETSLTVGAVGGDVKLCLDSYKDASELTVVVTDEQGAEATWLTTVGAGNNTDAVITATAQPLPEGASERVAKVKVSYPTCQDVEFTITQTPATGITTVKNSPLAVTVNGDNIVVSNVVGEVVVYDVTGKIVAKAQANGTANIAASLSNGVYIIKSATKTAKFIK